MDILLIATLGGLGALAFWGVSDWFSSRASKQSEGSAVNLTIQAAAAVAIGIVWLFSGEQMPAVGDLLILLLVGLLFTLAYLSFIRALSVGEVGIVVPLANTYPLITLLLAAMFLSLTFSGLQIGAIVAIIAGAMLLGTERVRWRQIRKHLKVEVLYAFSAALFWGLGFFVANLVVERVPWEPLLGIITVSMFVYAAVIYSFRHRKKLQPRLLMKNRMALVAGVCLAAGSITFYAGSELAGSVLIPAVIASASPLVTSFLAFLFDKERIIMAKRAGAVLVVVGVVLLNLV